MAYKGNILTLLLLLLLSAASHPLAACLAVSSPSPPEAMESPKVISEIQQNLNVAGLFDSDINGVLDQTLASAIKLFQKQRHLPIDGKISEPMRLLLKGRDKLQPDTLISSAAQGRITASSRQLSGNPQLNSSDEHGWTPLLYAVLHGNTRAVSRLLSAGAHVDTASFYGTTPLMVAVIMNRPGILQQLLKKWPDLDLPNHRDESAEEIAFALNRNHLLIRFRKHREAMKWAKLRRIPPFKVRMITWDKQECYRATTARINVTCQIDASCKLRSNTLKLCHERAGRYMDRLTHIVQKKWGGKPKILTEDQPDKTSPLNCREGDVLVLGIRLH